MKQHLFVLLGAALLVCNCHTPTQPSPPELVSFKVLVNTHPSGRPVVGETVVVTTRVRVHCERTNTNGIATFAITPGEVNVCTRSLCYGGVVLVGGGQWLVSFPDE